MEVQSASRLWVPQERVFGPGHLGELTQVLDCGLVDAVLAETGAVQKRVRVLPSRVVVYFVLALALFDRCGYLLVWGKLTAGLGSLGLARPCSAALSRARRRVGPKPLQALFEAVAGPVAAPGTPGVFWRGLRLAAVDGTGLWLPDTPAVTGVYRKRGRGARQWGYPMLQLCVLVECGTRALIGAVFGPDERSEITYAAGLLPCLVPGMLLLADANFDNGRLIKAVAGTGAQMLCRSGARRCPLVGEVLPDGSYLTCIPTGSGLIEVRVIEATITVSYSDGSTRTEGWRLITTLLDHGWYPAADLITLYHQRWEAETTFRSIKSTILDGRVLRSRHAQDAGQEVWALLAVYQAIIRLSTDAVTTVPGLDPDRASFTIALEAARNQVITAQGITHTVLIGAIGKAVLSHLNGRKRQRTKARSIKHPTSKYAHNNRQHPKTALRYTIHTNIMIFEQGLTARASP